MSSVLIIGRPEDATRMSKGPLKKWPNLPIDPVDMVALAKLCVFLTGDDYEMIIKGFTDQTPEQPDVEPWDLENLLDPVFLIPGRYVRALSSIEDDQLPAIAKKWCVIPELKSYKIKPSDMAKHLVSYREFARQSLKAKKSMLLLLAP